MPQKATKPSSKTVAANKNPQTTLRNPVPGDIAVSQSALFDPAALTPGKILALQRVAGNQAVQRLLAQPGQSAAHTPPPQTVEQRAQALRRKAGLEMASKPAEARPNRTGLPDGRTAISSIVQMCPKGRNDELLDTDDLDMEDNAELLKIAGQTSETDSTTAKSTPSSSQQKGNDSATQITSSSAIPTHFPTSTFSSFQQPAATSTTTTSTSTALSSSSGGFDKVTSSLPFPPSSGAMSLTNDKKEKDGASDADGKNKRKNDSDGEEKREDIDNKKKRFRRSSALDADNDSDSISTRTRSGGKEKKPCGHRNGTRAYDSAKKTEQSQLEAPTSYKGEKIWDGYRKSLSFTLETINKIYDDAEKKEETCAENGKKRTLYKVDDQWLPRKKDATKTEIDNGSFTSIDHRKNFADQSGWIETKDIIYKKQKWRCVFKKDAQAAYNNPENLRLMSQSDNSSKGGRKDVDSMVPEYLGTSIENEEEKEEKDEDKGDGEEKDDEEEKEEKDEDKGDEDDDEEKKHVP